MPTRKKTDYPKSAENPLQAATRELQTLEPLLKLPITKLGLDGWVGGSTQRAELVADTVWGTIQWSKSLGPPGSRTLARAFKIEHVHHQVVIDPRPGHLRLIDLVAPHPEPIKWDGPEDDAFFRVSFVATAFEGQQTRISARFDPSVFWPALFFLERNTYVDIQPLERRFSKPKSPLVLAPFVVASKPYFP